MTNIQDIIKKRFEHVPDLPKIAVSSDRTVRLGMHIRANLRGTNSAPVWRFTVPADVMNTDDEGKHYRVHRLTNGYYLFTPDEKD